LIFKRTKKSPGEGDAGAQSQEQARKDGGITTAQVTFLKEPAFSGAPVLMSLF
jgi:hypothetical protein